MGFRTWVVLWVISALFPVLVPERGAAPATSIEQAVVLGEEEGNTISTPDGGK